MTTTTLRIDTDLKSRVAEVAKRAGKTAHGYMVEAITRSIEDDERYNEFQRIADERLLKMEETGEFIAWEDMRAYLLARTRRENPPKPKLRRAKP